MTMSRLLPRRRNKSELEAELGEDLVEWGRQIEALYDDLLPDGGGAKPDDGPPPSPPPEPAPTTGYHTQGGPPRTAEEREVRGERGQIMSCIICGQLKTVDGRYCKRHAD